MLKVHFSDFKRGESAKLKCNTFYIVTYLVCCYESHAISKHYNEIQVRPKHYITLCACILFLKTLLPSISLFSDPLFTRQNPFKSLSRLEKTHYHPSRTHSLSKTEKRTVCSDLNGNCLEKMVGRLRCLLHIVICRL